MPRKMSQLLVAPRGEKSLGLTYRCTSHLSGCDRRGVRVRMRMMCEGARRSLILCDGQTRRGEHTRCTAAWVGSRCRYLRFGMAAT